ncbi:hypothetical protein [Microtetraspora niveoalba]|nr:hypothetical protein [Microtetraspora niveoalba]
MTVLPPGRAASGGVDARRALKDEIPTVLVPLHDQLAVGALGSTAR